MKKWKVVADPVNKGKHPLHDSRYIMTEDAETTFSEHVPTEWALLKGSIVCRMTDIENQPEKAKLIAAAPELLDACKDCIKFLDVDSTGVGLESEKQNRTALRRIMEIVIAKATN